MTEARGFPEGIRQRDDGIVGTNRYAFSTIDAFLFDDHGFAIFDPDRLGGTHPQTFHPAIALFWVDPNGMEILTHFIPFCLKIL
jgi:hypothetical protein